MNPHGERIATRKMHGAECVCHDCQQARPMVHRLAAARAWLNAHALGYAERQWINQQRARIRRERQ